MKYIPVLSSIMFTVILFFELPFYVAFWSPDIVLMDVDISMIGSISSLVLSKLTRTKFLFDIRSMPVEISGFYGRIKECAYSLAIHYGREFFDGATVITSNMKSSICETYRLNPRKVGVWSSGVSTDKFKPISPTESNKIKSELGLDGKFVVFYHGSVSPTRGLVETVEAISLLKAKYPDIVFFLLGLGPTLNKIKILIHKLCIETSIVIHKPVHYKYVPKFIAMADVCISPLPPNPYWVFQAPLKVLEYLAMGKVVIVTDIPAHRLVIGSKICGVYVSSTNPIEIAKAIEYTYNNKTYLESWGKVGLEIIEKDYTWDKVAKKLELFLLSISSKKH